MQITERGGGFSKNFDLFLGRLNRLSEHSQNSVKTLLTKILAPLAEKEIKKPFLGQFLKNCVLWAWLAFPLEISIYWSQRRL